MCVWCFRVLKLPCSQYKGPCKIYALYGAGANGVRGHYVSPRINNRGGSFVENIYSGKYFFVQFYSLFLTLDTTCADNKDKPMAGCKNQLIKKCWRNF